MKNKNKKKEKESYDESTQELECQLERIGLKLVDVIGDGNCMFRALGHQLHKTESTHLTIRKQVVQHIITNPEMYQPFIEEPLKTHTDRMAKPGVYGANLELVAFCNEFKINVCVHQAGLDPWVISPVESATTLHVAYHSWEHYSSIKKSELYGSANFDASELKAKKSERKPDDPVTNMEMMIMNSTSTEDILRIRQLLVKYRGNPNAVIDELFAQKEDNLVNAEQCESGQVRDINTPIGSETVNVNTLSDSSPEAGQTKDPVQDKPLPASPKQKVKEVKKVSAREKKLQAKKEQKQKALDKKRNKSSGPSQAIPETSTSIDAINLQMKVVHI
jgi:OTU domain-containing protein 3